MLYEPHVLCIFIMLMVDYHEDDAVGSHELYKILNTMEKETNCGLTFFDVMITWEWKELIY